MKHELSSYKILSIGTVKKPKQFLENDLNVFALQSPKKYGAFCAVSYG